MTPFKLLGNAWIAICGLVDIGLLVSVIGGVTQGGIRKSPFAFISFGIAVAVLLLASLLAFTYIAHWKATRIRKHGFLAVGAVHVVLAALFQIGPAAKFIIPGLLLPGATYFVLAFLTQRHLAKA